MSLTANQQIYEQQVINFLQSCTIVFSPTAAQINTNLQMNGIDVNEADPTSFKYYLNISGQYHSSDTMMYIQSLDAASPNKQVAFTTNMLTSSPKTKAAYVIGSPYYDALCQMYPDQTDLIKSIVYPVNINDAINAQDFTLLGWGDNLLEVNEQDVIIQDLQEFIQYIADRWYMPYFSYEVYYTWAFWAIFWQSLPNAIFAARLKYLHTSSVNSFHIWSYLQSKGIGDYSDILTPQQALFLYRNLDYLEQNRGKQSTLAILVNNLLDTLNVGLVSKTIYMNTQTNADACIWVPEFVSKIIPTILSQDLELVAPENMTQINTDLVAAGLDVNNSPAYIQQQQTRLGLTPLNIIDTKLVEIQKIGLDQKYGDILNRFILDTLVYAIASNLYATTVSVLDPTSGITVRLSCKDALALYYYAVHRSNREQPTLLPTIYAPSCAFRPDVTAESFPTEYSYNGRNYPTKSYLSLDMMLTGLGYPQSTIIEENIFSDLVANLFLVLVRYIRYSRTESNKIALDMFIDYCNKYVLQTASYKFSLSGHTDYTSWAKDVGVSTLISQLDSISGYVSAYTNLADVIMTALIPENSSIYTYYAYTNNKTDDLYDRMKSLFVRLCSYNITFLDTDRTIPIWLFYNPIVYTVDNRINNQELEFDISLDTKIKHESTTYLTGIATDLDTTLDSIKLDVIPTQVDENISMSRVNTTPVYTPLTMKFSEQKLTNTEDITFYCLQRVAIVEVT